MTTTPRTSAREKSKPRETPLHRTKHRRCTPTGGQLTRLRVPDTPIPGFLNRQRKLGNHVHKRRPPR